jgi:predicted AlkP superfamily pyrophosphatase or phosphodiesterase
MTAINADKLKADILKALCIKNENFLLPAEKKIWDIINAQPPLDIDENNKVKDYRAFVQSNGMSAFIFLKDRNDKKTYNEVYAYLKKLSEENLWGFREVYTNEEAEKLYRLDGDFSFIVESDNYTYCSPSWDEPVITDVSWGDYHYGHGTHGYSPEKGPQAIFCCHGPSFKEGVIIPKSDIINEAPTITAAFGQALPDADGHVLTEILK